MRFWFDERRTGAAPVAKQNSHTAQTETVDRKRKKQRRAATTDLRLTEPYEA